MGLRKILSQLVPFSIPTRATGETSLGVAEQLIEKGREAEAAGNLRDACAHYREAVASAPSHVPAHLNLGVALEAAEDFEGARNSYEAALSFEPANPYALYNLGKLHFLRGEHAQAGQQLRAALETRPEFAEARTVLGNVLDVQGDVQGAAEQFALAAQLRPKDPAVWLRYGQTLLRTGRNGDAECALKLALALDPESMDAHGLLSEVYQARGDFTAAAGHLETVLRQKPEWADALFAYAHALMRTQRLDEADAALTRILAIQPDREDAHQARIDVLYRCARIPEMLELCRLRRNRHPERHDYECFELFSLNLLDNLSAEDLFERHRAFGARLERAIQPYRAFGNSRDPERRLRIGYVGGEFAYHPVARFLIPLLERHDRSVFETHCYSVGVFNDVFTERVRNAADVWHEAKTLREDELAESVHADGIDILVDLCGHSGMARLGAFARQPAPVQAAWLGYLNTTGLTRIQYRISDPNCDPPGVADALHTEQLVRLPHIQWCYRAFDAVDVPATAPFEQNGFITFGSFTQISKVTEQMLVLWARILREVPGSRLVIAGVPFGDIRTNLLEVLEREGIASSRVTLSPYLPGTDYFRSFHLVDIALDTFPYGGGTTTCDAVWMGVPVVTWSGTRSTSRSATSVLRTVGLADWVAASAEDYVHRAVRFALERDEIARLRRTLRKRVRASPLMDEAGFARDMEAALRGMWHRWCSEAG